MTTPDCGAGRTPGLGYCYLEMRLYEPAFPHMVAAQEISTSPIPLIQAPVIDLLNLAELHLRWADELERVLPEDGSAEEVDGHRKEGHTHAERAPTVALGLDDPQFIATARAVELCARPRGTAGASLDELREAYSVVDPIDYQGNRAVVGGALARALWTTGRQDEALAVADESANLSQSASDWQVTAAPSGCSWRCRPAEAWQGPRPAAPTPDCVARAGQQRLSTLQGAYAALQVETLHRDNVVAHRAANEDPLTGVGNRRALDDALRAVQVEAALATYDVPVSLLVIDLNDCKTINDTYGHVVGDQVLRAAVGVATAGSGHDVGTLLAEADAAMYDAKAHPRR